MGAVMDTPVANLSATVLADDILEQVETLARQTSPDEALWISGYFAGWARCRATALESTPVAGMSDKHKAVVQQAPPPIRVLYGTETGNSEELAEELAEILRDAGHTVNCNNLEDYKVQQLKQEHCVIAITSTHGDGDPPEPARGFFEELEGRKAPALGHLHYAVLGLGDTSYEFFCEAAKTLDRRFSELGGKPVAARLDCDVDYDEQAEQWFASIKSGLKELFASAVRISAPVIQVSEPGQVSRDKDKVHDKRRPFEAEVLDIIRITGRHSTKHVAHVEFSLDGSGLNYKPGDALGVRPVNNVRLVNKILTELKFNGTQPLADNGKTIADSLTHDHELSILTPEFLQTWYSLCKAELLKDLSLPHKRAQFFEFASRNHVLDVIRQYPVADIQPEILVNGLRKIQPRMYSIASSQEMVADEVHITVARLKYELNGSQRFGAASSYLCGGLEQGQQAAVYIQNNNNFRLPEDASTPIIMIGAGTGIAPYRAFLQQREATGVKHGPSWLIFGERNFRSDFLYQVEWQQWLRMGFLHRISLAFSRDSKQKIYVQHRLLENGRDIYHWLQEGACIYVCGDASHMAKDVNQALVKIISNEADLSEEKATEYLKLLSRQKRYQKDVY